MPFTLSHPVAVLPLRGLGLPVTALVIGSMVPDLPLFLGWPRGYAVTHSLAGVVTVDPVLTVLALAFWLGAVRDVLVDLSLDVVRSRLAPHVRLPLRAWLLAPVAATVGALTHVVWDLFTHPHRWGTDQVEWLHTEHAGLAGSAWAQYVSGVAGLVIVGWSTYAYLSELPVVRSPGPRPRWAWAAAGAVVAAGAATSLASAAAAAPGLHAMAFDSVVNGRVAVVAGTTALCVAWHVARP